jgi:hypothetical protein
MSDKEAIKDYLERVHKEVKREYNKRTLIDYPTRRRFKIKDDTHPKGWRYMTRPREPYEAALLHARNTQHPMTKTNDQKAADKAGRVTYVSRAQPIRP